MKTEFNQHISTYWWNYGSKKNDFKGNISTFFKERSIKVSTVKHPAQKNINGLRFKFDIGSAKFQIDSFDSPNDAAIMIVKLFLTYLGDRAQIVTGSRIININR